MIDAYKRFPLHYRLLAIAVLTLVSVLLGWQVGEPLLIGTVTLAVLMLLHVFLSALNSLLAFIVILVNVVVSTVTTFSIYNYGLELTDLLHIDITLLVALYAFAQISTTGTFIYLAYKVSRGRIWVNLATALVLSYFTVALVILINPLFYLFAFVAGFVVGVGFLLLRKPNRKKKPAIVRQVLTTNMATTAEKLFKENDLNYHKLYKDSVFPGAHYFAYNKHSGFIIIVVQPAKSFNINSSTISCDDVNIIPLIESVQDDLYKQRKNLPVDHIEPLVLVLSPFKNLQAITSIAVSRWKQPDFLLKNTHILTKPGFSRFVRASKGEFKPLKESKLKKMEIFSKNLT